MIGRLMRACALGLLGLWLALATGCGHERTEPGGDLGTLSVPLLAGTPDGHIYRLRGATILVAGPVETSFETEVRGDAFRYTTTLPIGEYTVELVDGWYLERRPPGATAWTAIEAALTSPAIVAVSISRDATSTVTFSFFDDQMVSLGDGQLDVNISVSNECDPVLQNCPSGQKCAPVLVSDQTYERVTACVADGTVEPGSAELCEETLDVGSSDSCAAGSVCLSGDCRPTCTLGAGTCNCSSNTGHFADRENVGLCMCDLLQQDCGPGRACYYHGTGISLCVQDASAEVNKQVGDPCSYLNECPAGSQCANDQDGQYRCTSFCDTNNPSCPSGTLCTQIEETSSVGLCAY
jgi:hypothetical protein